MFEGLDDIQWNCLSHAYGKAKDVPGLLRVLQDGSEESRSEALSSLFGNIVHQGTVYEATPHTIPFLLEIVRAPDALMRAPVLSLLQEIAIGWVHCQQWPAHSPPVGIDVVERWTRERSDYQVAHDAVANGFSTFVSLLEDVARECNVSPFMRGRSQHGVPRSHEKRTAFRRSVQD